MVGVVDLTGKVPVMAQIVLPYSGLPYSGLMSPCMCISTCELGHDAFFVNSAWSVACAYMQFPGWTAMHERCITITCKRF